MATLFSLGRTSQFISCHVRNPLTSKRHSVIPPRSLGGPGRIQLKPQTRRLQSERTAEAPQKADSGSAASSRLPHHVGVASQPPPPPRAPLCFLPEGEAVGTLPLYTKPLSACWRIGRLFSSLLVVTSVGPIFLLGRNENVTFVLFPA